jgi:hypothetical protein
VTGTLAAGVNLWFFTQSLNEAVRLNRLTFDSMTAANDAAVAAKSSAAAADAAATKVRLPLM